MRVFAPPAFLFALVAASALMTTAGCGLDPDGSTGEDGRRDVAQPIALDEWVTDENGVSFKGGDRHDWKKIITPKSGTLSVEVAADNNDATLIVGLYDRYGKRLLEKVKTKGDSTHLTFEGDVSRGHYFLSVMARGNDDASIYSIRASMGGGYGAGDIPPPE
jgi:hypothetical protein